MNEVVPSTGKYLIIKPLTVGGMASLLLARKNEAAAPLVVIKKIVRHYDSDPTFIHLFRREAQISLSLKHPNIVETHEIGGNDRDLYIVMEYLKGANLREIFKRASKIGRSLSPEALLFLIREILQGLNYLHEKDIVHRDISPQNVMIDISGRVKIIDFGISKSFQDEEFTQGPSVKGKFSYMSPEQAEGKSLTPSSDIFSMGILIYELVTGRKFLEVDKEVQILTQISGWSEENAVAAAKRTIEPYSKILPLMLSPHLSRRPPAWQLVNFIGQKLQEMDPDYGASEFINDIKDFIPPEVFAERTLESLTNTSAQPAITLFAVLTETVVGRQKHIESFMALVFGGILLFGFFTFVVQPRMLLADRTPSKMNLASKAKDPQVRLQFPQDLTKDMKIYINGRRMNSRDLAAGVLLPEKKPFQLKAFSTKTKKWRTQKVVLDSSRPETFRIQL